MGRFARAGIALDAFVARLFVHLPWESRGRRRGWLALALFMTVAPAAFCADRQSEFFTSVKIFPRPVGPFSLNQDIRQITSLLSDPLFRGEVRRGSGAGPSLYRHLVLERSPVGVTFTLLVGQPTPEAAKKVTDVVALQLAYASGRRVSSDSSERAAILRQALVEPGTPAFRRARIRRQLLELRPLIEHPPNRFVASGPAPLPKLTHWADRVADALPGPLPRRTSPFWAGLAGLALAALLWAASLRLAPPVRRPAPGDGPDGGGALDRVRRVFEEPAPAAAEPEAAESRAALVPAAASSAPVGWHRWLWLAILSVAPVVMLLSIRARTVNVPFYDEWNGLVPLFQAQDHGTLHLSAFWSQHNEHRPAFPRAIQFAMAYVTKWDVRAEMYLNFAVAVATFGFLLAALRRSLDRFGLVIASVVASVLFFSPVQWENWLWGWQLEWFLANLAGAGMLWALTVLVDRSPRRGLAVAAVCAFVGTFSIAQGLLLWPVGLALVLLRRRPWRTWALLSVVVPALYLAGWHGQNNPSAGPVDFVRYVLIYLGRIFGVSDSTGSIAGAALLVGFGAGAAYVVSRRDNRALVDRAAFWLGLGLYAVGAAVLTAIGRAGMGVFAVSRYAGMAELFAIATLGLLLTILLDGEVAGRAISVPIRRRVTAAMAAAILFATLVNLPPGFRAMDRRGEELAYIGDCTRTVTVVGDPCLDRPVTGFKEVRLAGIEYLRSKGWAGY
jgi:hypothetical protein